MKDSTYIIQKINSVNVFLRVISYIKRIIFEFFINILFIERNCSWPAVSNMFIKLFLCSTFITLEKYEGMLLSQHHY